MSCCSREEIESLRTRWKSTKAEIYEKRIRAYASIIKSVVDAENLIRAEIASLAKKQAVKIDCKAAMGQVNRFLEKNNNRALWTDWQKGAKTCLLHTMKLKIGLFCAICTPNSYLSPWASIFINTSDKPVIQVSDKDCKSFVTDCHLFIRAQMNIREYFSAVAALSKCDERGWTDFDQEYLYRPQNAELIKKLDIFLKNPDDSINYGQICEAEYSLSTMLASDLNESKPWLSFVKNAESIFKKFKIKNDSPKYFYQADDENSVKQDLSDYKVQVSGGAPSILSFFDDGKDGMASKNIDLNYISDLISGSNIFTLFETILFLTLICIS